MYKLKVENTSEELAARGVSICISIPPQIEVNSVDARFSYLVAGDTYTFSGIDISPSSMVLITMNASAKTSGDVRVMLEVSTDAWQGPPGVDSLLLRVIQ